MGLWHERLAELQLSGTDEVLERELADFAAEHRAGPRGSGGAARGDGKSWILGHRRRNTDQYRPFH